MQQLFVYYAVSYQAHKIKGQQEARIVLLKTNFHGYLQPMINLLRFFLIVLFLRCLQIKSIRDLFIVVDMKMYDETFPFYFTIKFCSVHVVLFPAIEHWNEQMTNFFLVGGKEEIECRKFMKEYKRERF